MSTTELYEFHGPNFKVPILLCWHDVIAEFKLHPDVPLLKIQRNAVEKRLLSIGAEFREDSWWLEQQIAQNFIVISLRTDPEEVLEWMPLRPDAPPKEQDYQDPFISDYTRSPYAMIKDNLLAELVWQSFAKFMLHRLLNEQKPVDLYFASIVPLQMRVDWKAATTAWEARFVQEERYKDSPDSIIKRGVADFLAADYVTGVVYGPARPQKKNNDWREVDPLVRCRQWYGKSYLLTANWTLEIVTKNDFHDMARHREMEVNPKAGNQAYWRNVTTQLKSQLPRAIEVYADYLKKAALPAAMLLKTKPHCVPGIAQGDYLHSGKRTKNPYSLAGNCAVSPVSEKQCLEKDVAASHEGLREVPDL